MQKKKLRQIEGRDYDSMLGLLSQKHVDYLEPAYLSCDTQRIDVMFPTQVPSTQLSQTTPTDGPEETTTGLQGCELRTQGCIWDGVRKCKKRRAGDGFEFGLNTKCVRNVILMLK